MSWWHLVWLIPASLAVLWIAQRVARALLTCLAAACHRQAMRLLDRAVKRSGSMRNPPHPGDVLLGLCLEEMDPRVAAQRLGMDPTDMDLLLQGKRSISPAVGLQLEAAGWSNAAFWMRLQGSYDLAQERLRRKSAA